MPSIADKEKRQKRREKSKRDKRNNSKKLSKKMQQRKRDRFSNLDSRSTLKKEHQQLTKPYFSFKLRKGQKKLWCFLIGLTPLIAGATSIIPTGFDSSRFYYQIGGGSDYLSSAATYATPINLSVQADLGLGKQCGMYNPALSISNTLNDLEDSVNNLTESLIANATGSLAEMPMYFLALANPTLYNLLNNSLISAHTIIDASVKSCEETRDQIAQGKNPYQDWATLSIGDSWKSHLSLTATGDEDINAAQATINQDAGDDGVVWVQGKAGSDGTLRAAGKNQPPVHVVADTIKAGYNALLNRDFSSDQPAPANSDLAIQFPVPQDAVNWTVAILGDQNITTCTDASCKAAQGTVAGRGLLPWMTICTAQNNNDCVGTINQLLQELVSGSTPLNKENLLAVSANDLVVSPTAIHTLQSMDVSQQGVLIHKLAQEVAMQRIMEKALMAREMLQTGRQAPAISVNRPAQLILQEKIAVLDSEIRSLSFEAQVRKQMMSDTLLNVMDYSNAQQSHAFGVGQIQSTQPVMENSAIPGHTNGGH